MPGYLIEGQKTSFKQDNLVNTVESVEDQVINS